MSVPTRWIVTAGGLACFLAPYELLIRPGPAAPTLATLPFWMLALTATAIGLLLAALGLLGPARNLVFDPDLAELSITDSAAFGLAWSRRVSFNDIGEVRVERDDDTDGPAIHVVTLAIAGGRPLVVERFRHEAEAAALAAKLDELLRGGRSPRPPGD